MQASGLCILVIGLRMTLASQNDVIVVLGLCTGGIIGYALRLEARTEALAERMKHRVRLNDSDFVHGFVHGTMLYCVGAMAIMGALEAGLKGNFSVLYAKSTIDGIIAVVLGSTMGIGVAFSGLAVLVYQGALTLLAGVLEPVMTDSVVSYLSASGGVLIAGIGLTVAGIKDIRTLNLLPGVFIAAILGYFFG